MCVLQGCRLLICPELGVYVGLSGEQRLAISEPVPQLYTEPSIEKQRALKELADIAHMNNIYLVCSVVEKADHFYNTTVVFDPSGRVIGRHRKIHLYLEAGLTPSPDPPRKIYIPEFGQVGMYNLMMKLPFCLLPITSPLIWINIFIHECFQCRHNKH